VRKSFAIVGGVAAIALAAGCSSSGSDKSTSDSPRAGSGQHGGSANVVLAAFSKTTAGRTAKIVEQSELGSGKSTSPITTTSAGTVDLSNGTGQLVSSLGNNQSMTVVFTGGTIYEKLPPQMASVLKVRTPWAKFSTGNSGSNSAQGGSNPMQYLNSLQGASDNVTKVGTEPIDGTPTTHYRATVDLDKAAQRSAGLGRKAVQGLEQLSGKKSLPVEVWVDGQGRLRRESTAIALSVKGANNKPSTFTTRQTIDLSGYGTPVKVTVPPADQTTDITKQMTS
jgi:hypothetical protein